MAYYCKNDHWVLDELDAEMLQRNDEQILLSSGYARPVIISNKTSSFFPPRCTPHKLHADKDRVDGILSLQSWNHHLSLVVQLCTSQPATYNNVCFGE
eukprot:scaffold5383_cov222-Amphora_coffeaeformis.AAC.26